MKMRMKSPLAIFLAFLMIFGTLSENTINAYAKENETQVETQGTEGEVSADSVSAGDVSDSDAGSVSSSDLTGGDAEGDDSADVSGNDLTQTENTIPGGGGISIKPFDLTRTPTGGGVGTEVEYLLSVAFLMDGTNALAAPYFDGWYYAGDTYTVSVPNIPGYEPRLGSSSGTSITGGSLTGIIQSDTTITIVYVALAGQYTVLHKFEQVNGSYVTNSSLTEIGSGYINQMTNGQAKTVYGYTAQPVNNVIISSAVAADTEVEILYTLDEFPVKFQSNGGTYITTQYVKYTDSINLSSYTPTRTGYTFAGWYADAALTAPVSGTQTITADTVYYAKWTPASTTYTVLLWLENAEDTDYSLHSTVTGVTATTASVVTVLAGTYSVPYGTYLSSAPVTIAGDGSSIVNVYFSRNKYTINFKVSGTTVGSITAKYQANIASLWAAAVGSSTAYGGYVWYSGLTGYYYSTLELMPGYNMDLTHYSFGVGKTYVVNYWVEDINGGYASYKVITIGASPAQTITMTFDEEYHPILGYDRDWSDVTWSAWDSTGQASFPASNTANLYYKLLTYTITYVNGNLSSTASYKFTADISGAGSAPTSRPIGVYSDWTFGGWYLDPDFQQPYNFSGKTMPANHLILYAKWNPPTYTVTFQSNGGTSVSAQSVVYNNTASEPATDPTRTGYFFSGWYSDAGLTTRFDFGTLITKNTTVYAKWVQDMSTTYTVKYLTTNDGGLTYTDVFPADTYSGTAGYMVYAYPKSHTSLTPDKYDVSILLDLNPSNNIITFIYAETQDVWYRVQYVNSSGVSLAADKVVSTGSRGVIEYAKSIPGYSLASVGDNRQSVTLAEEYSEAAISQNVVTFTYYADFTNLVFDSVSVYYDGLSHSAALSGSVAGDTIEYSYNGSIYQSNPSFTDAGTYAVSVTVIRGGVSITRNATVEIKKAPLNIVTKSATKYYDATPLTAAGNIYGIVNSETYSFTVTGVQDGVGTSDNTYNLVWNGTAKASNYDLTVSLGTLTVKRDLSNVIVVTAASDSKVYDGTALTNSNYTNSGTLYGSDYLEVVIVGTQTNAGTSVNLVSSVKVMSGTGSSKKDVTANYSMGTNVNGTLTVEKKPVTVTTNSDSKAYDGTTLFGTGSIAGILSTETVTFTVTGEQTYAGTSGNTYLLIWGTANPNNYALTENLGTLEITTNSTNILTIKANSDSKTYDGTALSNNGYTIASGSLISGHTLAVTVVGTQTNAGTSVNRVTQIKITDASGADVTGSYALGSENGTLTVARRQITVTTPSDYKTYDGTALTANGSLTGILAAETYTFTTTGSQINVGSSTNTYSLVWGSANQDNYSISENLGTLTVGYNTGNIISVTAQSAFKNYDGTALELNAYTNTGSPVGSDYLDVVIEGSQTDAGYSDNVVKQVRILRLEGSNVVDVTNNYLTGNHVDGILNVLKAPVTVTTPSVTKNYDGTPLTAAGTLTGIIPGETCTFITTGTQTEVGFTQNTYTLTWGTANPDNYQLNETLGTLTVQKDTANIIAVTAYDAYKVYDGTALKDPGYTYTGSLVGNDYLEVVITGSQTNAGSSANVVTSVKVMRGTGASAVDVSSNYNLGTHTNGTLTVAKKTVIVTTGSGTKIYDGTKLTAGGNIVGIVSGESVSFAVTGERTEVGSATNTYSLTWDGTADVNNYVVTEALGTLAVNRDASNVITITANSATKYYDGTALVNTGYTHTGYLVGSDYFVISIVGTQLNAGTSANVVSSVKIMRGTGTSAVDVTASYNIGNHVNGVLTVNKAPVTIITNSAGKVYDGTVLTASGTMNGLVNSETVTFAVTGNQTGAGSSANSYSLLWNGSAAQANYEVTESLGTLTVSKKELTITTDSAGKNYDGTALTAGGSINGLVSGETCTLTVTGSQTAAGSSVNTYTLSWGSAASANYTITENLGTLTVSIDRGNIITVTADSSSKTYDGTALTNNGFTYTGTLQGSDYLVVDISGTQTNAGSSTNVVTGVKIMRGTGAAAEDVTNNYVLGTPVNGTLTVYKKTVTVTTNSAAKVYDSTALTAGGNIVGILTTESVNLTVTGSQIKAGSSVNTYTIDWVNANKDNYSVVENLGTLTVTVDYSNAISVQSNSGSKVYDGAALKDTTYTYTGILQGSDYFEVTITGSQTDAGSSANTIAQVKIYRGTGQNKMDVTDSYAYGTNTAGVLTVTRRTVTIVTRDGSKVYDGRALAPGGTISGIVSGETYTFKVTGSQIDVGTSANTYSMTWNGTAKAANYAVTATVGTLTVIIDAGNIISVTADSGSKQYDGTPLTVETFTNTGVLKGDDYFAVTMDGSQLNVGSSVNAVAQVKIMRGTGAAAVDVTKNYIMGTNTNGTLEVTYRDVYVTANNCDKIYGENDPSLSATIDGLLDGDSIDFSLERHSGIGAGGYTIIASGEEYQSNYRVHYANGMLTIKPREVTVYIDSYQKGIGEDDPAWTVRVEGLLGGDTLSYKIVREPGEEPGTYLIYLVCDELQGSYYVKYVVGTLTIGEGLTTGLTTKSPKTGVEDYLSVWNYGLLCCAAALTGLVCLRRRRRR